MMNQDDLLKRCDAILAEGYDEFAWLIEITGRVNASATYYTGEIHRGGHPITTTDAWMAKHYANKEEAQAQIATLPACVFGTWEAVEHGFARVADREELLTLAQAYKELASAGSDISLAVMNKLADMVIVECANHRTLNNGASDQFTDDLEGLARALKKLGAVNVSLKQKITYRNAALAIRNAKIKMLEQALAEKKSA